MDTPASTPHFLQPGEADLALPQLRQPSQSFGVNVTAELVADLVAATGLLGDDRLAQVRGRAAQTRGSFAQALLDEGLATGEGRARLLATRHHLPLIELGSRGVDQAAASSCRSTCSSAPAALPYALRDGVLYVAIADPTNVHAIDELRLATRLRAGVRRRRRRRDSPSRSASSAREAEAFGRSRDGRCAGARLRGARGGGRDRARGRRRRLGGAARPHGQLDHLPGGRGRRLGHPFRAAGGRAHRPLPRRRRPPGGPAHPEAADERRPHAPEGRREARHRRAAPAAGRTHDAERRGGGPQRSTSASRRCRQSTASRS